MPQTYSSLVSTIFHLIDSARRASARTVNTILTATYWDIGRRIVQFEQRGKTRAAYGEKLLEKLACDLGKRFGRGFSRQNLQQMREFYIAYPPTRIRQTVSGESKVPAAGFLLSWSHYVRLLSVNSGEGRRFYETEALKGGWSVRQLDRQISSLFYERTVLSKNKAVMLKKGGRSKAADRMSPEEEIKDPYVLEFLGLKDEYSENELEDALIRHLERFLLELGGDFAFVGRQKRLRVGNEWYRIDLIFFHRRLKSLVVIDLKTGKFTHADAGQMHLYLNYARSHWMLPGENPPVGLILCASKDEVVAKYALEGLRNKILARKYQLALPNAGHLADELRRTHHSFNRA